MMTSSALFPHRLQAVINQAFVHTFQFYCPEIPSDQEEPGKKPHNSQDCQRLPSFVQQNKEKKLRRLELFYLEDPAKVGSSFS